MICLNRHRNQRKLDDSELDSGDDEGRTDRVAETVEEDEEGNQLEDISTSMFEVDLPRVKPPEGEEVGQG